MGLGDSVKLVFEIRGDASHLKEDFSPVSPTIAAEVTKIQGVAKGAADVFRKEFGYLPTISRQAVQDTGSTVRQAADVATQAALKPLTALEKEVLNVAKRLEDKNLSKSLTSETNRLIADNQNAVANLDKQVLHLRDSQESLNKSFDKAKLSDYISSVVSYGVALGAVVTGIYFYVKSQADAINQTKRLSDETNFTVETISALEEALGRAGAPGGATSALTTFNLNLSQAHTGTDATSKAIRSLNLDLNDNEKALRQAFVLLNSYADGGNKSALASALFGERGRVMLDIIEQTNGSLDEAIKKYDALGAVIHEKDVAAANEFSTSMSDMKAEVGGVARELGETLMPVVYVLAKVLEFTVLPILKGLNTVLNDIKEVVLIFGDIFHINQMSPTEMLDELTPEGHEFMRRDEERRKTQAPALPKGGGGGVDKARQDAERALEQQLKGIEDKYKEHTEKLAREYKLQEINLANFKKKSIDEENDRYKKTRDILEKQLALAKPGAETEKYQRELEKAEAGHQKTIQKIKDEAAEKEIASLRKHLDDLEKIAQEYDKRRIDGIRALEDLRVISHERAESRVADVEEKAADRHYEALQQERERLIKAAGGDPLKANQQKLREIDDALKLLEAQEHRVQITFVDDEGNPLEEDKTPLGTNVLERQRRIAAAHEQDVAEQKKYNDEIYALQMREAKNRRDIDRQMYEFVLNSPYSSLGARRAAIAKILDLDLQELDIARLHNIALLNEEEEQAKREIGALEDKEKKKLEIHEHYEALRQQEDGRVRNERAQRSQQGEEDTRANLFPQGLNPFGNAGMDEFIKSGDVMKGVFADVKAMGLEAFGSLARGFGQMVGAWASGANLGEHAVRKLVASVLAGVAAQAAVQAVLFTAYGIAALTPWGAAIYGPASQWFIAAGLMASIAIGTALAGRAIAPRDASAATSSLAGNRGTPPAATQPTVTPIKEEYNPRPQKIILHLESNDSHIIRVIKESIGNNGEMRDVIIETAAA